MHKIKEQLTNELKELEKKNKLSAGDLDVIHKLTDTIKNIDKIEMYEDFGEDYDETYSNRRGGGQLRDARGRYSRRGDSYESGRSYYDGGDSYDDGNNYNYDDGMSNRRGGRGGRRYSRGEGKEIMTAKLREMMQDAEPHERQALKRCIEAMEND